MASSILTRNTARAVTSSLARWTPPLTSHLPPSNIASSVTAANRPVNDGLTFRTHVSLSPISLAANATSPVTLIQIKSFSTIPTSAAPTEHSTPDPSSTSPGTFDFNPENIPGWELVHSPPRKLPRGALVGTVVSDKMQKTVNVAVDRYRVVPIYRKRRKYTKKFMAHDEEEVCRPGDLVMIVPAGRKLSKHKTFIVREVVKAKGQVY